MLKLSLNIEEEEEAGGNDTEMPTLEETCNHTQLKKPANNAPLMAIPPIEEVFINSASSVRVLNSCAAESNLKFGRCINAGVLKSGLALVFHLDWNGEVLQGIFRTKRSFLQFVLREFLEFSIAELVTAIRCSLKLEPFHFLCILVYSVN
ncbi:hypothetical protein NE237_007707 [Protea cynaroides]|uniref:Uncharacterized protein n=1 Tax=Protea cynaroides TaxID=273540 RepID=A0A9Q0QWG1_9MAGN|nr:hypothetical protein NE237_007707 [Protea cynaroides]